MPSSAASSSAVRTRPLRRARSWAASARARPRGGGLQQQGDAAQAGALVALLEQALLRRRRPVDAAGERVGEALARRRRAAASSPIARCSSANAASASASASSDARSTRVGERRRRRRRVAAVVVDLLDHDRLDAAHEDVGAPVVELLEHLDDARGAARPTAVRSRPRTRSRTARRPRGSALSARDSAARRCGAGCLPAEGGRSRSETAAGRPQAWR